ncbi:MAG: hypothetical protein HOL66_06180 [Rhodospirillaceae bacterium]|jgi:hypothetical protein|nr:hypothetical protein [Rhodospirillaceae bacterium]MBT5243811.1 hypothetical protein [Rhodospirillaceae bacterium]MBT5563755.1 hypothetical protein [Rhodospirillaceae bacterium]MBT6242795.1 hypothetical protein [Rhodospirillaceae bacterium]MBT7137485.1 hypothetical protein [Rhodospirillaceae bacterium]
MRLTNFQKVRTLVQVALALALSFALVACGEDEKQASEAAKWMKSYSKTNPPNEEWIATNVAIDDKGQVVMDVLVPDRGQIEMIKSRTRVEQFHIVRMACPPMTAEVWTILSGSQVLWVNLLEKTKGGLYKQVIGASCRR